MNAWMSSAQHAYLVQRLRRYCRGAGLDEDRVVAAVQAAWRSLRYPSPTRVAAFFGLVDVRCD